MPPLHLGLLPTTSSSQHSPGSERWHPAFTPSPRPVSTQRWASALGYLSDGTSRSSISSSAPSLSGQSSISPFAMTLPLPVANSVSAVATTSTVTTTTMSVSGAGDPVVSSTNLPGAFAEAYQANMNSAIGEMMLHHQQMFLQQQQQQQQATAMLQHSLVQQQPNLLTSLPTISSTVSSSDSTSPRLLPPLPAPPPNTDVVTTPSPLIITPTQNVETTPQRKLPVIGQIMASPQKEFKPDIQGIMSLKAEATYAEESKLNIAEYYSVEKRVKESPNRAVPSTQTGILYIDSWLKHILFQKEKRIWERQKCCMNPFPVLLSCADFIHEYFITDKILYIQILISLLAAMGGMKVHIIVD